MFLKFCNIGRIHFYSLSPNNMLCILAFPTVPSLHKVGTWVDGEWMNESLWLSSA